MKMNIKILGPGCPKCKTLFNAVNEVVNENAIDAEVTKVEDIMQIMNYGVLSTPCLVINEKVVFSGRVPSKGEIKNEIEKVVV